LEIWRKVSQYSSSLFTLFFIRQNFYDPKPKKAIDKIILVNISLINNCLPISQIKETRIEIEQNISIMQEDKKTALVIPSRFCRLFP